MPDDPIIPPYRGPRPTIPDINPMEGLDMPKRIYAVKIESTIESAIFVVADSPEAAAKQVEDDMHGHPDWYSFNDESVWTETDERIKFLDVRDDRLMQELPKVVPFDEYEPSDHPDWDELDAPSGNPEGS
jgi:hypothetical protein